MKFGFLAHAVSPGHRNLAVAVGVLADAFDRADLGGGPERHLRLPALRSIVSATGARCGGDVRYLAHTAADLLRAPQSTRHFVVDQVRALAADGAEIVGLGGATSILGDRGLWTRDRVPVPVTSGNALTVSATRAAVHHVLAGLELNPAGIPVTIVGYPGSIGLAVARLLLADGLRLDLVHAGRMASERMLGYLPADRREQARLYEDVRHCYEGARIVVAASSLGGLIEADRLCPGSVIVDVALPADIVPPSRPRTDVLLVDGGLVTATEQVRAEPPPAPLRALNGCLAETAVLALEGRAECWSLGRELDLDRVREIGGLAERHGFLPTPLVSRGRTVTAADLDRLRRWHAGRPRSESRTAATARRFASYVNPPMADFLGAHGIDRVFSRARGCTLSTEDGTDYLDFVAGYGCLNLGHNHPYVVERLQHHLASAAPTFVQYVSMPAQTAELAERLCELAPGRMERVFFSNSGAEAVEAAIKLARAATGRTRLVHVANSYHGKTMGALSITGREVHREGFGPLVPDCVEVPYGDAAALAAAVEGAAAFVVEPVLGEGGVLVPPPGYLAEARRLCRAAGAVFVVDDVQTGLGRTGVLFGPESDGVDPDVLCLAKSLSGGLVPIGATLATAAVWDAAYGTSRRFAAHTSTFGGGNLAAAAGLATLDVLQDEKLAAHAAELGEHLRASLWEVSARHPVISEVRGRGLMNALVLDGDFAGAGAAVVEELLSRFSGDAARLADWLPVEATDGLRRVGAALESSFGDLLCLQLVRRLARDHRILTFVTANTNRVLRIQPPLVLTRAEADCFVAAVDEACTGLGALTKLT